MTISKLSSTQITPPIIESDGAKFIKQLRSNNADVINKINQIIDAVNSGDNPSTGAYSLAVIGDSVVAGAPYYTGSVPPTDTQDVNSWVRFVRDRLGITVYNLGIGGTSTVYNYNRFAETVLPLAPTHCIIEGGLPDGFQGVALSETQNAITGMVNLCKNNGIVPILMITTPSRGYTADESVHTAIDAIRSWMRTYAGDNEIEIIDAYSVFIHKISGSIITSFLSSDGLHPSVAGYAALGDYTLRRLHDIFPQPFNPQSEPDRKITFVSNGQAYSRDYNSGDVLINNAPTSGSFFAMGFDGNTFLRAGSYRSTEAASPCAVTAIFDTDLTTYYRETGDIILFFSPSNAWVKVFRVDSAGYSGPYSDPSTRATLTVMGKMSLIS